MKRYRIWRRLGAGIVVVAAVAVTSCSASSSPSTVAGAVGAGLPMGGGSGSMMGGGSGYHYSRPTCSAPALPGTRVGVVLADMDMTRMMGGSAPLGVHMRLRTGSVTVPAGKVSLVASNMGWRTHELVVLPLGPGGAGLLVPGGDGKVSETGSLGEASGDCAGGAGTGITAGSAGWVTLTLAAGRYELLCNLPNHYADGMWQELDIT